MTGVFFRRSDYDVGFTLRPDRGEITFRPRMSRVRFAGVACGCEISVEVEAESVDLNPEHAADIASKCAEAVRDKLFPSHAQLLATTEAVNDAIATEAARLERVTAETNQAYSHVCNQLALAYDRIAVLEQTVMRMAKVENDSLRSFDRRFEELEISLRSIGGLVDAHSSMVNSFSNFQTGADSVLLSFEQRLAELETPKRAAAKKKAATKKVARTPRKKRGD